VSHGQVVCANTPGLCGGVPVVAGRGWEKVTAFNRVTGNETVLSVEHAWVERDLPESTFGERAMRAGPGRYFK